MSKRFFKSESRYGQADASPKAIEIRKKDDRQLDMKEVAGSAKRVFDEAIEGSKNFLEIKNQFYPAIFLLLVFFGFLLAGAPPSTILPIAFFFIPAFLFFRFGLGQNIETSTAFAIPFAIAFDSIVFRISLLFSLSAATGWISLLIGWVALFIIGFAALRFFKVDSMNLLDDESQVRTFRLYFLIVSFAAILMYSQIFGPFTPDRIFWGSNDANWQMSTLNYINQGTFAIPDYLCTGNQGYDLDSFTSTTSLIGPFIVKATTGSISSLSQEVFLFLCFMMMIQGVFLLIARIFDLRTAILSALFAMLPLSIYTFVPDFLGIWRVSMFNAFFPWALLLGIFWIDSIASFFLRAVILVFIVAIQPFNALLVAPVYLIAVLQRFDARRLLVYTSIGALTLIFLYFTFIQVTFNTIGAGGSDYQLRIGLDEISKVDAFNSLTPRLQISFENLGLLIILLCIITLSWLVFSIFDNPSASRNMIPIALCLAFGFLIASGIIHISDTFNQYILKMRYTLLLVIVFPLSYVSAIKIYERNKAASAFAMIVLILMGLSGLMNIAVFHSSGVDLRSGVLSWFLENAQANDTVMFQEEIFGQSAMHLLQVRHMPFPENITSYSSLNPEVLLQKEVVHCSYKRYGLFDVRYEQPANEPHKPDYMISLISEQELNDFFKNNSYSQVYSDQYFVVFNRTDS